MTYRSPSTTGSLTVLSLVAALAAVATRPAATRAAPPEVRGVWLTTTGPNHIQSGLTTPSTMTDLRSIGLNAVYVETWKNGYTNYPSQRLAAVTGGADRSTFLGSSRDLVQETLIHAHRNQMAYIGWFEYGFAAQFIGAGGNPNNPLAAYMKNRGWLLQNQNGQYGDATNGYAWMNPAVPEVRQLLIELTLEAVNRYDLDGIQFDDRLAWPVQFGFDATTLAMYAQETGQATPTSPNNSQFRQWRQSKVTQFAVELRNAVKAARPDLLLSVAPSITSFSTANYNANWPSWQDAGIFDEYAVQAYRADLASFNAIIDAQTSPFQPDDLDELVVGLRINGSGASTPYSDLQAMIERARAEGAAGHSFWYSSGVLDAYAEQLTEYYDVANAGHASNPQFPTGHRPAPIIASLSTHAPNAWSAEVLQAGRYRLVAKVGNFWKELAAVQLQTGRYEFALPSVSQVELLADRRTSSTFVGDFVADGVVDGADFLAWQQGFGGLPSSGDANLDGRVNAEDLLAWRLNRGSSIASTTLNQLVPEPMGTCRLVIDAIALTLLAKKRSRSWPAMAL